MRRHWKTPPKDSGTTSDSNLRGAYFLSVALGRAHASSGQHHQYSRCHGGWAIKDFPIYNIAKAGLKSMTLSWPGNWPLRCGLMVWHPALSSGQAILKPSGRSRRGRPESACRHSARQDRHCRRYRQYRLFSRRSGKLYDRGNHQGGWRTRAPLVSLCAQAAKRGTQCASTSQIPAQSCCPVLSNASQCAVIVCQVRDVSYPAGFRPGLQHKGMFQYFSTGKQNIHAHL